MSPEQATGDRAIDRRADIYSLGAVIYEMLTGGPPHVGATVQATIAKVITERPQSITVTRPAVPDHVALAVEKALEKTPADRWTSVREFAEALQGRTTLTHPRQIRSGTRPFLERLRDPITLTLAVTVVALAAGLSMLAPTKARPDDPIQFSVVTHGGAALETTPYPLAISPDGRTIAYVARDGFLYVRTLSDRNPRRLAETNGANVPFFSSDGSWVGYYRKGKLFRAPVGGGASLEIADVPPPLRISWTPDGLIVFSDRRRIITVPATGGRPKPITRPTPRTGKRPNSARSRSMMVGPSSTPAFPRAVGAKAAWP
jgi:serine/threonine-protein kinase